MKISIGNFCNGSISWRLGVCLEAPLTLTAGIVIVAMVSLILSHVFRFDLCWA